MKRLARCAIAALLATSFAAPVLASPPPVLAPVVASLPTLIVSVATVADPPIPKPIPRFVPVPTPTPSPIPTPAATPAPTPAPATPTVADAQAYALAQLGSVEYRCLSSIAQGESRWRPTAWNTRGSGAYGIGQAKPASKMAPFGADYMTNPITQVRWMIAYVVKRYGSACGAAAYRAAHGFY